MRKKVFAFMASFLLSVGILNAANAQSYCILNDGSVEFACPETNNVEYTIQPGLFGTSTPFPGDNCSVQPNYQPSFFTQPPKTYTYPCAKDLKTVVNSICSSEKNFYSTCQNM